MQKTRDWPRDAGSRRPVTDGNAPGSAADKVSEAPLARRLRALMAEWPTLSAYGLDPSVSGFEAERADLARSLDEVSACVKLLAGAPRVQRPGVNSYALKHQLERAIGTYISNGTTIAAAVLCGIVVTPRPPNALLGIRPSWLKLLPRKRAA